MKFQILNIIIYGLKRRIRSINIEPDAVNIITGQSKTGKSALVHIVDYCLGSKECNVPPGVIQKNVTWYALKLQVTSGEIFIARRNPSAGKKSSEEVYIELGKKLSAPSVDTLVKNANTTTLVSILTENLGIIQYAHEVKEGETRNPGVAHMRKALFYCYQEQSEIDSQKFLFHRQGEPHIPQSMKDYLPYFLGAVTNDVIDKKEELRMLNRELKKLQIKIAEQEKLQGHNFERAFALINEAKNVDLIAANEPIQESWDSVKQLLGEALDANTDPQLAGPNLTTLDDLIDKQKKLRDTYRNASEELKSLNALKNSSNNFSSEIKEQKSRLESINIFERNANKTTCPLCSSALSNDIPSTDAIRHSLAEIDYQLSAVSNGTPHLNVMIRNATDRLEVIRKELSEINMSVRALQDSDNHIARFRDFEAKRAMIKGRLSLYLESLPVQESDTADIKLKCEEIIRQIKSLENELDGDFATERLESIISIISQDITRLAKKLEIEHSEFPMRLDLKKLTIVADSSDDGPIPMTKMGSGETWVGLHLATHLALHTWFHKKKRPVPQFLFFDQPSQAYYPPDTSAEIVLEQTQPTNPDRQSIIRMFKLIADQTCNFQVLITEHVNINEPWFQDLIRENWWGKQKLVPIDWTID